MQPRDRHAELVTLGAFLGLAVLAAPLDAHTVLRTQGQAVIESNRIMVTLEVSPENFAHQYGLTPGERGTVDMDSLLAVARRHADNLTATLQLWDEGGEPLVGEPFDLGAQHPGPSAIPWMQLRAMRLRYTASYLLPSGRHFLTLRMGPTEQISAIARIWVIEVRTAGDGARRRIQLTSRGNTETLELRWSGDRPELRPQEFVAKEEAACAAFQDRGALRFHDILVDVEAMPDEIRVRSSIPLPLVETWISAQRLREGSLDTEEQSRLLAAAQPLLSAAVELESGSRRLTPSSLELQLRSANMAPGGVSGPPESIGYFTSRLEALQRFPVPEPAQRLTVSWKLFNSAVLSARAAIRAGGRCTPREFTSYSPTLTWPAAEPATPASP
jgi:hypothetical protein